MVILGIIEVMTQIEFERYGCWCSAAVPVFVVYSLRTVLVDVGVIPEGKGGVRRYDVALVRGVWTCGRWTGVVELVATLVETYNLRK